MKKRMKKNKTLVLSADNVNTIVRKYGLNELMDMLIQKTTAAIEKFDTKHIDIPIRSGFNYDGENLGLIEMMPVHVKGSEVIIKVVGYHPSNPINYQLPTILSSISSYDTETGHLKAIADGVLLTALRTGAASAIATKRLATSDSSILGLIGCGAQAITQLHALSRLFEIKKVLLFDVDTIVMHSFSERITMLNLNIDLVFSTIEEIVKMSDIVCTETSIEVGEGPLFSDLETQAHVHINAIGSDFPGKVEIPLDLLKQSLVCPDFLEQAKIEGECQQLKDSEIGPSLVELVQNSNKYAFAKAKPTVFDSTGWALEDQVVMDLFLELAIELEIGQEIALENISEDAKNPYNFMITSVIA
jgi:ornithine cyclodeaminase/alanine dehydrogenase-like protein (mu-crystallin family)